MSKSSIIVLILIFSIIGLMGGLVWWLFGSVGGNEETEVFVVPQGLPQNQVSQLLQEQDFIHHPVPFDFLLDNFASGKSIQPGGYNLSTAMNVWQITNKLTSTPDLIWATISKCQRKEQIGEKLAQALSWKTSQVDEWNSLYNQSSEYFEGVYYPDTYLIPVNEPFPEVAQRFINRFNEELKPLTQEFLSKNIKWTTGVKIASLIARETDNPTDMKLISGIIWNRLNMGMLLQIDSTMQYTLGKDTDGNWWGPVDITEKLNESPYNTYLHKGLPPTPICSPSIEVIEAALNPIETECLFYLHDRSQQIHCAKTYEEHLENVDKYLN